MKRPDPSSKTLFRRLAAAALAALLIAGTAQPLTAYAAAGGERDAQAASTDTQEGYETRTLYTLKYDTKWENASKVKKGNTHDCQHLDLYVPAGVTFKIRQTNSKWTQNMTFRFRNDDQNHEKILTLKANGEWLEYTPEYDSVPTISSHYSANGEKPVVEYTVEGTKQLPVYQYGGDEAAFFDKWDELDAPFAMLESTYTNWLLPARDKTSNTAGTLDDLLLYYDNMIGFYNAFSGLSVDADEEWNRDSESKYFVKANAHGYGAAYYHVMETAPNSNTLVTYMQNAGGWGPLHEVAHGYDTMNFDAVDIWNNVLSHYYQVRVLGKSVWLNPTEERRATFESQRAQYGYFGNSGYDTKLYFWINMLDKLGPQKTSAYAYQLYRKNVHDGVANIAGHSFYADAYTRGSGFNVTPWMEMWGFTITDEVKRSLIEAENYENVYPLRNLVETEETAKTLQAALGLESMYSLVETGQLVRYHETAERKVEGTLTVKLDELTCASIKGKEIRITDGKTLVKTISVTGRTLTETLPAGVYNIHVPGPEGEKAVLLHNSIGYVVVTEGKTTEYTVTATRLAGVDEFVDWTIALGSNFTYNGSYFVATTDLINEKIHLVTRSANPHTYYDGRVFSSFKIEDGDGKQICFKEHFGKGVQAEELTVELKAGYTITVTHAEPNRGCKVYSSAVNGVTLVNNDTKESKYLVTEKGLKKLSPEPVVEGEESYYRVTCAYLDGLKADYERLDFQTPGKLSNEKAKLTAAFGKLTDAQKESFKKAYEGYYPFDQGVQELTIAAISDQDYTGAAVTPALTVRAGETALTAEQYRAEWTGNVEVGSAKVRVYGLGDYAAFAGEAGFAIVQPESLSRSLTVQAEYASVQFTGGYKYPSVTVSAGGRTLTRDVDYTIVYADNRSVGTATVTARGIGSYAGFSGSTSFEITKRIQTLTVSFDPGKVNHTGQAIELPDAVTVWDVRNKLTEGTDYTLTYTDNVEVGTATVTATGTGNYEDCSGSGSFEITDPDTPQPTGSSFSGWKYHMEGYEIGGRNYLNLDIDVEKGQMRVVYNGSKPHGSFRTNIYASVSVFDTNNSRSFYKGIQGGVNGTAMDEQVPIGLGYVIKLYFAEPTKNNSSSYSGAVESIKLAPKSARYLVTAQGLKEITEDGTTAADPASQYDAVLRAYMDGLKAANPQKDFTDPEKFPTEKAAVEKGLLYLDQEQLARFKEDYVGYYPFSAAPVDAGAPAPIQLTGRGYTQGDAADPLDGTTTVEDGGTISYQWFRASAADDFQGTAIQGETGARFTPDTETVGTAYYYVVATNTNAAATGKQTAQTTSSMAVILVSKGEGPLQPVTPIVTPPAARTLTYNGAEQVLIAAGSTTAGALEYSLTSGAGFSTELPKAANAGDYTVYYRVTGGQGVADVAEQSVPVIIQKAAITLTAGDKTITAGAALPELSAPVAGTDYTVSGLMDGDSLTGTLRLVYQKDGQAVTPDNTKAGTYDIVITGVSEPQGGNYHPIALQAGTLVIQAAPEPSPEPSPAPSPSASSGDSAPLSYSVRTAGTNHGAVTLSTRWSSQGKRVSVTLTPEEGYAPAGLSVRESGGDVVELTDNGDGSYTFVMPAASVTVTARFAPAQSGESELSELKFVDVSPEDYCYDAVRWAVENKLTEGIGGDRFGPQVACTRAQMMVFLWRAAGSPEPEGREKSFSDVNEDAYYYKAVLWAVEKGITNGVSTEEFVPDQTVTRAQVAAFLHRASGAAGGGTDSGFRDVSDSAYYAAAVAWAAEQGITSGIGGGLFAPDEACTRGQIVTMLFRAAGM